MAFIDTLNVGQRIEAEPTSRPVSRSSCNAGLESAPNPLRRAYTTGVEHHPAIVIDGPLQGDWLAQVVTNWLDGHASGERLWHLNIQIVKRRTWAKRSPRAEKLKRWIRLRGTFASPSHQGCRGRRNFAGERAGPISV